MTLKARLAGLVRRKPLTAEELEARQEALRLRDEMETIRVSQRSSAGENYQSGR
jgi:hypothetical protein